MRKCSLSEVVLSSERTLTRVLLHVYGVSTQGRHVVKYIEKYLNTNTNTFHKIKYKYKYKYSQMQMYLNTKYFKYKYKYFHVFISFLVWYLLFNLTYNIMTYKSLFTHINHHMTYYLSQTWPWCAGMPLHLLGTLSLVSGLGSSPKQLFCPFWWNKKRNYNWPFISRNMRLIGDVCSKVRFN